LVVATINIARGKEGFNSDPLSLIDVDREALTPTQQVILAAGEGASGGGTRRSPNRMSMGPSGRSVPGPKTADSAVEGLASTPGRGKAAEGVREFASRGAAEFDVARYGDRAPGFENHHGVLDKWAADNVPGYSSRAADGPTLRLSREGHAATKAVYRDWLMERTGKPVGGKVDWRSVSPREAQALTERMFDAAGVPAEARSAYYSAFNNYIYTGQW
jgi:hypothetical protein